MGTHNICPNEEVDKNYTGCNLKTTELLECALIGACVVIRSNTVFYGWKKNTLSRARYCFGKMYLPNHTGLVCRLISACTV